MLRESIGFVIPNLPHPGGIRRNSRSESMASHDHDHHHHHHHSHDDGDHHHSHHQCVQPGICPLFSWWFVLMISLTAACLIRRLQGRQPWRRRRLVGRGGRARVALARRPRAALPRAHLLPRRLLQARAAAHIAALRGTRLHRRHRWSRRHWVGSAVRLHFTSYCAFLVV